MRKKETNNAEKKELRERETDRQRETETEINHIFKEKR